MSKRRNVPRKSKRTSKIVPWLIAIAVIGTIGYVLFLSGAVAYGEREIRVVDFSFLNTSQKRAALQAANSARCTCGCGMTLAQCVSTDATCPVRADNIDRIRTMAREAAN